MASAAPALALAGLVKRFGDTVAVAGVDLTVPAGSFYGLVGPNGAGKTTTLSMATGLLRRGWRNVREAGPRRLVLTGVLILLALLVIGVGASGVPGLVRPMERSESEVHDAYRGARRQPVEGVVHGCSGEVEGAWAGPACSTYDAFTDHASDCTNA